MLAEYSAMLVNCCLMVSLFLGGWTLAIGGYGLTTATLKSMGFLGGLLGTLIFVTKVMTFMMIYIWFRGTFPRFRFDQLMDLGWKWMIPLALVNIAVTAVVLLAAPAVIINGSVVQIGETILAIVGAATIAFTLFLLFKPRAHAPKVIHASRVSEA
jgi:hypothetical protein